MSKSKLRYLARTRDDKKRGRLCLPVRSESEGGREQLFKLSSNAVHFLHNFIIRQIAYAPLVRML